MDKPGSYDAKLQAALEKLQTAADEVSKIITDRRIEHKDRPMEIAIAKAIIKDKTGKEPETDTIGFMTN